MNQSQNKKTYRYDLEERTERFSTSIIEFCKKLPKSLITSPMISQLIRSATSIGANYREANGASSKRDFKNKILICKKESKETEYWLRLLSKGAPDLERECRLLAQEAHEFTLIFSKIAFSSK